MITRCTSPFNVVDDDIQEPTESFNVFIIGPPECLGNPSLEDVNILDNDNGMLTYAFQESSSLFSCSTLEIIILQQMFHHFVLYA